MNLKNILLVVAIIIIIIGTFTFLFSHQAHPKADSKIIITSDANLTEGDTFSVKLTDMNSTPISNQTLNVTIIDSSGKANQQTLTTNETGEASFEVDNSTLGNCVVKVKYGGNDKFNGCNFTDNIIINQKVILKITNTTSVVFGENNTDQWSTNSYQPYSGNGSIITVEQ